MIDRIQHGGALDRAMARYGGARGNWLDLSTGINPLAYPIPDFGNHIWTRLPDDGLVEKATLAARLYYGVSDNVALLAVAGAQAAIQCLGDILPDGPVHIVEPCYGEYAHVLGSRHSASLAHASSIVLANPNNPDGKTYSRNFIEALLDEDKTVIIDEAFCDVMPEQSLIALAARPNVLIMKSFGKFFGLAGVRLGFVMGDAGMVAMIAKMLGPWAVSGPALSVGTTALADTEWIMNTHRQLSRRREALQQLLSETGFEITGATNLFVTAEHAQAAIISEALACQQILVRSFDYAPTWLRFGLPADDEAMARLKRVLATTT